MVLISPQIPAVAKTEFVVFHFDRKSWANNTINDSFFL